MTTLTQTNSRVDGNLAGIFLTAFAGLALVLSMVGIYGVMSYFVVLSTRELGIRLALGAGHSGVIGLVVRRESHRAHQ